MTICDRCGIKASGTTKLHDFDAIVRTDKGNASKAGSLCDACSERVLTIFHAVNAEVFQCSTDRPKGYMPLIPY